MPQSRDIEIDAGQVIDHDVGGRAALKRGKSFDVTEAALARVDRGIRAAFFRYERDQLFMIRRAAIRASQTLNLPTRPQRRKRLRSIPRTSAKAGHVPQTGQ